MNALLCLMYKPSFIVGMYKGKTWHTDVLRSIQYCPHLRGSAGSWKASPVGKATFV